MALRWRRSVHSARADGLGSPRYDGGKQEPLPPETESGRWGLGSARGGGALRYALTSHAGFPPRRHAGNGGGGGGGGGRRGSALLTAPSNPPHVPLPTPSAIAAISLCLSLHPPAECLRRREASVAAEGYVRDLAGRREDDPPVGLLGAVGAKPKSLAAFNFIRILSEDEEAFDVLYCTAFEMMDAQWLALRASYMQFNEVLNATKSQLERELCLDDIRRIQDLPAYNLLYQEPAYSYVARFR